MNRQNEKNKKLGHQQTHYEFEKDYQDTEFSNFDGQDDTKRTSDCCNERKQESLDDCKKGKHKTNC